MMKRILPTAQLMKNIIYTHIYIEPHQFVEHR